ncbi:MAG: hypothetical protein Q8P32_04445, partial [Candidatus Komeilibacteria bacterium]|nr:hypothetical protein [Candidatus Komeilibacteria bacterium]
MEIQDFVKINKDFWSQFKIKQGGKKILIEEPRRQALTHVNAVMAMILNLARGYEPVWFYSQFCQPQEILDSYFPGAQTIADKDHLRLKVWAMLIAILKFPKIYFTKNILAFSYAGVRYGDILYDSVLHLYKLGTVRKIDYKVLRVAALCVYRHLTIKKILRGGNYAGILVSHQIGIGSGIMLRAALSLGYEGYLRCGQNQA